MGLFKSAINQVGRDLGRVVSNEIFKDAHSTPIRVTGQRNNTTREETHESQIQSRIDEFESSIAFNVSYTPKTLINKLSGVYTILKNITQDYISDGHLDSKEIITLTEMNMSFNRKCEDIHEVLSLDEEKNEKEIEMLNTLFNRNINLWINAMKESVDYYSREVEVNSVEVESNTKEITNLKSGFFGSLINGSKVSNLENMNIELNARISRDKYAVEYLKEMIQKIESAGENMS